jgi:hypothetical protein
MRHKDGPTSRIIAVAIKSPGGVIRWHEAETEYLAGSSSARREHEHAVAYGRYNRRLSNTKGYPSLHYHSSINNVLKRHFSKVEGTRGFYVLNEMLDGNNSEETAD